MADGEVVHLRVEVRGQAADHADNPPPAAADGATDVTARQGDDRLRPLVLDRVQHGVRDLVDGLVPGDALPLPLTALTDAYQRVEDALLAVERTAPGGAFL